MTETSLRSARFLSVFVGLVVALVSTSAAAGDVHVYEVGKKVADFPAREDLSTPEAAYASIHRAVAAEGFAAFDRLSVPRIAALSRGVKLPVLPRGERERWLTAEIVEVHVWEGSHAVVIARRESSGVGSKMDLRWLERVDGRWLNEGNDARATIDEARKKVVQMRSFQAAQRLRDERPPVPDPAAHLRPFVDFLRREGRDPRQFVLDALAEHRVVILGEIHHRPRYWAFNAELVRSPEFARRAGVIYLELPSHDQGLVDRFLAAPRFDPQPIIDTLRDNLWMGWPDQPMLDFFHAVWDVNQRLAKDEKLRVVLVDMARPWKEIRKRDDWRKYDVDRDQFMAANVVADLKGHAQDPRHALFVVGYGHAMRNLTSPGGEPMKSAGWHLRETLGEADVFAVFPHGPVVTNNGEVSGRLALGLFETAFAALGNKPVAFPLDHGLFGEQVFDAAPERLTADPYRKGYQAYLYLGPLDDEVFSPLIPGFYSDEFVRELDRRARLMDGKGLVEAGIVSRLDGPSFAAWMGTSWGQPRGWTTARLGPLDAWQYGSHWEDAMRKRVPAPQATTGKVIELYDVRSGRESIADLESGSIMAPDPVRGRRGDAEGLAWLKEKGLDLIAFARTDSGDQGLVGYEMVVARIDNHRFDPSDASEARRAIEEAEKHAEKAPAVLMSTKKELPVTYAFRTREGSLGVLQIIDVRLHPTPAVFRLRYKVFKR
jgi:hypothetical protein